MNSKITLMDRAEYYRAEFPDWPPVRADKRWIDGAWVIGNNYKGSGYYGSYPPGYLKRVGAMFPDAERVLHLFSGSLPASKDYLRFDIRNADITGDAHHLRSYFPKRKFDMIYADPPYSTQDAEHYGTCMVRRNVIVSECVKVLEPGGFIAWLDQVLPMFRKTELQWCGFIGIARSTNHRVRGLFLFRKL